MRILWIFLIFVLNISKSLTFCNNAKNILGVRGTLSVTIRMKTMRQPASKAQPGLPWEPRGKKKSHLSNAHSSVPDSPCPISPPEVQSASVTVDSSPSSGVKKFQNAVTLSPSSATPSPSYSASSPSPPSPLPSPLTSSSSNLSSPSCYAPVPSSLTYSPSSSPGSSYSPASSASSRSNPSSSLPCKSIAPSSPPTASSCSSSS